MFVYFKICCLAKGSRIFIYITKCLDFISLFDYFPLSNNQHHKSFILKREIHTEIPITFPCWTMHLSLSHFWLRDNVFTIYNLHNMKMLSCYFKHFWSTVSWEEDSISQAPYFLCFSPSSPLHPLSFTSSSSYTSHFIKHLFNCHCF